MPVKKVTKKKIGIVVSRFNEFITKDLLDGCVDELKKSGIAKKDMTIVWVPGALEIPVVAQTMAKRAAFAAVITLGCVIRGETYHFELVAEGAAQGVMQAGLATGKPVTFGVIACDTLKQAYKRSSKKGENKGREAAQAALEMLDALKQIRRK